jgi:hypothetical protein
MERSALIVTLLLGACAAPRPGLLAYAPTGGPVPTAAPAPPDPRIQVLLRDPQQRQTLMVQLRYQLISRARAVPDARYYGEVRPGLARQLRSAGLAPSDVEQLLGDVDYSRRW